MADDLTDTISSAAQAPKTITVDGATVQEHELPALIEADRYLTAKTAVKKKTRGLRFNKLTPGD